jgi:2'-5' RNA ligase
MYTWHVTFDDQSAVREVAAQAQARLSGLPGLDLVPARWLHLTMQGVGFTDEVSAADVELIADAARERLMKIPSAHVKIGPARVASEGVAMGVAPHVGLTAVRQGLRAAIADVWSRDRVLEPEAWTPHVSIAYSQVTGPAEVYAEALADEQRRADAEITRVQLIALGRDEHGYEWTVHSNARLSVTAA